MSKNPARNYAIEYVGKGTKDTDIAAIATAIVVEAAEPTGDPLDDVTDGEELPVLDVADGAVTVDPVDGLDVPPGGVTDEGDGRARLEFLTNRGGEQHAIEVIALSGDAVELDWSLANRFDVTLTDDPDITFAGLPAFGVGAEIGVTFRQDATGGRSISSWPASVSWYDPTTGLAGAAPTLPTDPGASLFVLLATADGGSTVGGAYQVAAAVALDDLSDVTITSPAELDVLRRVGSAWINDARIWRPLMDGLGNVVTDTGTGDAVMALA